MSKIRVAIVEDDHSWINAMVSFLKKHEDIIVVGTAKSEAASLAKSLDIDVLLMDINLNGNKCDGIYAVTEIL
ncbi:MAG TPA: response regulator [Pseudobacteroides sp.]|uniref:response regulator transcription factor n=1 Tax=Pseudobacteroides sp. TaxID=1968840 RepID=UPI002F91DB5A